MKKSILLIIICLGIFVVSAQTTYPTGATGCIARWTFDVTEVSGLTPITDVSNNGNHAVNNNVTSSAGWKNIPKTAGKFNGTNSWGEVADKNMLKTTEFTLISLVKLDAFNFSSCQGSTILCKGYPEFISGNYGLTITDNFYDGSCNIISSNQNQMYGQLGAMNPNFYYAAGNYLNTNQWYFLAVSISNNELKNYQVKMDPNVKQTSLPSFNTVAVTNNVDTNYQNISIGTTLNPSYPYFIDGDIDELILFNKALTDTEVYNIYSYLYGAALSNTDLVTNNKFNIDITNHQLAVLAGEQDYAIEIFNLMGQKLRKFTHLNNNFKNDLSANGGELLVIKITNNKGESFSVKKINK